MHIASQLPSALFARLPLGAVVQIQGKDSTAIANNLTTNDVAKLAVDESLEAFVTDVRGWVVAHGLLVRLADAIWIIGQFPDPASVVRHVDRYIVREDAHVSDCTSDFQCLVASGSQCLQLVATRLGRAASELSGTAVSDLRLNTCTVKVMQGPFIGADAILLVAPRNGSEELLSLFRDDGIELMGVSAGESQLLERLRIQAFWPMAGREIVSKTLPQELGRDRRAISFTKGCYLGQETVARLDALGQLQKKLCRLHIHGPIDAAVDLVQDDKSVGQITSYSISTDGTFTDALAYMKRGFYAGGTTVLCGQIRASVVE